MKSSDQTDKINPALIAAHAEAKEVAKGGYNTFDKYRYATLEDIIGITRPLLAKHGLAVLTSCDSVTPVEGGHTTSQGKHENACHIVTTFRVIHTSGQWYEFAAAGEGQDRADKSVYKAMTGSRKYGLCMALNLVTTDDPENDDAGRTDAKPDATAAPPAAATRPLTPEQKDRIWNLALKLTQGSEDEAKALLQRRNIHSAQLDAESARKVIIELEQDTRAEAPPPPDGARVFTGLVHHTKELTSGEKNGRKWTLYGVTMDNDLDLTTFDSTVYSVAHDARTAGTGVRVTYTTGEKRGKTVHTITAIEPYDMTPPSAADINHDDDTIF